MKKRILVLLSIMALIVAMLAVSIVPSFAAPSSPCPGNNGGVIQSTSPFFDPAYDRNSNGLICKYDRLTKDGLVSRFKDDHPTI